MLFFKLVILFWCYGEGFASTVHEIKLPGSKSVKIFEDDTSWNDSDRRILKEPNKSTDRTDTTSSEHASEENFDQYALEKFLNTYADKLRRKHHPNAINKYEHNDNQEEDEEQSTPSSTDKEEKSKRFHLMHVQKHKHPFEDKTGWVSLDPVPWSLSEISKWHSEKKPVKKPESSYESLEKPWETDLVTSEYDDLPTKPSWYQKPRPYKIKPSQYKPVQIHTYPDEQAEEETYYQMNKPTIVIHEPEFEEPSSSYDHKVQIHYNTDSGHQGNKHYIKRPTHNTHRFDSHKNCDHSSEEIITDGQPSNFPVNTYNRRKSSELPENHPFEGNGDWVLLSTTKGYKSPQKRHRSIQITSNPMLAHSLNRKSMKVTPNYKPTKPDQEEANQQIHYSSTMDQKEPDSVRVRKGVQLTVLPPLKNSNVNMTTSHGGLLQVESTFETVEQAQQRHARKFKDNFRKKPVRIKVGKGKIVRRPAVQKLNVALPVTSLNERMGRPDISAVLAAAGAGMIPATMAMLVPMALGGKRRRRDLRYPYESFLS